MHRIILLIYFSSLSLFPQVRFDADFPSGNLKSVSTVDSITYTIITKSDIGGRWFYFRMTGVKDKYIRVNVSSSDVLRAMYSYDNITYQRYTAGESPATNVFQKTYPVDTVFAAYYTPYTLSYLSQRIAQWRASNRVKVDTLGFTLRNLPIVEMSITDRSVPDSLKEHIWIHARTHPGETPSSWHFDGIIQELLSEKDVVNFYLQKLVFHCIPFTNPDGVYYGRSRTNFDGVDVESNWNKADSLTSKEVLILKARMRTIYQIKPARVFLNLHSQAAQFCTFWVHTAASTSLPFYKRELLFGNLNTSENPYFTRGDYSYSTLSSTFPEGWQWNNWGDKILALTYETPYDFYSTNAIVDNQNLAELGTRTVYAIGEYLALSHPQRIVLDNTSITSAWTADTAGTEFFGKNYLSTTGGSGKGKIILSSGMIPAGKYQVYSWYPSSTTSAPDVKMAISSSSNVIEKFIDQRINGAKWNLLGTLDLMNQGEIVITVSDSCTGKIAADAFRILYLGAPSIVRNLEKAKSFELFQNYPNPFNGQTIIKFRLDETSFVKLDIYDCTGQIVKTLVNQELRAGTFETLCKANDLPSGVYYYRLQVNDKSQVRSMVLLK